MFLVGGVLGDSPISIKSGPKGRGKAGVVG